MTKLIQKNPKKDCYFLAIKRAIYGNRYAIAKQRREDRQAFLSFKHLVITTFNAKEVTQ